jgi:putative ABC transport system substrate-binding protein
MGAGLVLSIPRVNAQSPKPVAHIGILTSGSRQSPLDVAFIEGLAEYGYVEGKNLAIEFRGAQGHSDLLANMAAELVAARVDIIIASGSQATGAAQKSTTTIPIVAVSTNPVGLGFAASLARPGGNITGLSLLGPEVAGKRLELLREIIPGLSRVTAIWVPEDPAAAFSLKETQAAAGALRIDLQVIQVHDVAGFERAFQEGVALGSQAVILLPAPLVSRNPEPIAKAARQAKMPALLYAREGVKAGSLVSYGADIGAVNRRIAYYVDRILRGAKPADLPIEQPTKFEMVVNLGAAKSLGLSIPQSVLARADELIE